MTQPLPDVHDPEFAPFWAGAAEGELRLVFCSRCQHPRWPPRPICPDCGWFDFEWRRVRPEGHLYTWTIVEHQTTPGIPPPYVVGLVEVSEYRGVRLLGQIVGDFPRPLQIGMSVVARFDRISDAVTLVNWSPTELQTGESNA
jgi:uncharacterized OB-fold protein